MSNGSSHDASSPEHASPNPVTEIRSPVEQQPVSVVGIGASAGGLEALERLFRNMPDDTGLAFLVVQHLSPNFKSLMNELLSRHTALEVHQAEDGMPVAANSVYVLPPKKEMIICDGRLHLTDKDPKEQLTLPIDHCLRSLAQECGERAIAVILSGTGSDGSRGIRDVHEAGGLVIAQSPETARFDGMSLSAQKTGVVDVVLPPEEIPKYLTRYVRHNARGQLIAAPSTSPSSGDEMNRIFSLLRQEYGIDFSHYKSTTITRRTERRLQMSGVPTLEDYVEKLTGDAEELNALYHDLLIGVTRFFRDREAFTRLSEQLLPELCARIPVDEEFRVWVAGCATGEEAYSIAILLYEHFESIGRAKLIKIFATDVHRGSLEIASDGFYRKDSLVDVSEERLQRFFMPMDDGYRVCPEIRKLVVFAPHNVIKDAPFTRIDLISCRNLLIYLNTAAQKKALSMFHFALKAGGCLFLGPSETPGSLLDEFDSADDRWKIYRKRRDIRLSTDLATIPHTGTAHVPKAAPAAPSLTRNRMDAALLGAYDALLAKYVPPSLLVNEGHELLHVFGDARCFLSHRSGRPTLSVLELVDSRLKPALGAALHRVFKERKTVRFPGLELLRDGELEEVQLIAEPILHPGGSPPAVLITFESVQASRALDEQKRLVAQQADEVNMRSVSQEQLHSLEEELSYTRENLQATIEELETSNQELQATNEELVAANEELQSTNEELHSVNEELYTVNTEHQRKIDELTELNNDMEHLLASTEVHTIFLDRDLRIRRFTPKIADVFNLLPQDVGRRIDGFTHSIQYEGLIDCFHRVIRDNLRIEEDVRDRRGRQFLMRILPYQAEGAIGGVVLTLIDISSLKRAEADLKASEQKYEVLYHHSPDLLMLLNPEDGVIRDCNRTLLDRLGYTRDEIVGKKIFDLYASPERKKVRKAFQQFRTTGEIHGLEAQVLVKDGSQLDVSLNASALRDAGGRIIGCEAVWWDITRRAALESRLRDEIQNRDRFLAMLSHELRNPLGALLSASSVLDAERVDEQQQRQAGEIIQRQVQHMSALLDDLLEVSRLSQGRIRVQKRTIDLTRLITPAVETVRPLLDSQDQGVELDMPDHPVWVTASPARIHQVLVNLLTNASRYSPPGETIHLRAAAENRQAVIRVKDNGIGIQPDMLNRIFDLFVQGERTLDRSEGGMGIGLTLVRWLVELHGGTITAHSAGPGQGSEFVIRLPLVVPPKTDPEPEDPEGEMDTAAEDAPPEVDGQRVLIVEDNRDAARMLATLLKLEGFEVLTAADGRAGLELARQERPDVALIDIGLPEIDGYEVARRIRNDDELRNVRLVALTGYAQQSDRRRALQAGFDDHLAKPFKPEKLVSVLRRGEDKGEGNREEMSKSQ